MELPAPLSLADAFQRYLAWCRADLRPNTVARLRTSGRAWTAMLGKLDLAELSGSHIETFKAERVAGGRKPVSVRNDLFALSGMLRYARLMGWIAHDPLRLVKIPSDRDAVRVHPLSPDEERRYLASAAAHEPLACLAELMLRTGMRPGEVLGLRVSDVDLTSRHLHIRGGKSAAARRSLLLTGKCWEIAQALVDRSRSQWLFPGKDPMHPLTKLNNPHRRACTAAGVRFCLYDLRHTFATRMAEKGMPLTTLAVILGHSGLRCVTRYIHPSQRTMDEAMERFST